MRRSPLLPALLFLACNRHPAVPIGTAPSPKVAAATPTRSADLTVAGKVIERIDASSYSYLHLATAAGEQWAAVPQCQVKAGAQVVVTQAMPMDGFESKTLKRKFDHIVFGVLQAPGAPATGGPPASPHGATLDPHARTEASSTAPADRGPFAVPRATGAHAATVAELYARRAALKDQPVRVHAKVVKVLTGILGKNWLHVRDGSGTEANRDNDLTVTTDAVASVGAVVLVQGTLHTDRDIGSGYTYKVIVEDAQVTQD